MKLGIITHKVIKGDGQGRVNYEVTWEAIRRGYSVTLIATEVAPELLQNYQVHWISIPVKKMPTTLLRNLFFSKKSKNWLQKYGHTLNLIQTNGAITNFPTDVNVVHFIHDSWLKSPAHTIHQRRDLYGLYQWFYTILNSYFEKRAFSQAKVVVAVSKTVKKDLLKLGVSSDCIQIISNGVDLQEFSPELRDRQTLGLPENVTLALFVGDIRTPRKNLDTVLKALVEVPKLHLAVVGSTEGSPYPSLAAKLAVQKRVHFLGYRQDVSDIMKACDFFVFPSRYETFGLVVIEAMATGLPVITASTTGSAEIVTPECGFVLSDPEDIEALIKVLNRWVSDRKLIRQMSQAARTIAEKYSWVSMARCYINLFEEMSKL